MRRQNRYDTQIIGRVVSLVFNLYDCLFKSHKAWIPEDDSNNGMTTNIIFVYFDFVFFVCVIYMYTNKRKDADGNLIRDEL